MKRIGIFGLGCIGSVLAKYFLLDDTNKYFLFNRSKRTQLYISYCEHIFQRNIKLETRSHLNLDWLVVSLKEYHLENAKTQIANLVGPKTKVAVFRNGLDLTGYFKEFTPEQQILETLIDCPIQKNTAGKIIQLTPPKITLPNNLLSDEFTQLLNHKEIAYTIADNFEKCQWEKLIESSSLGSVQVYTGKPCFILKEAEYLELYTSLIKEGIAVANSEGMNIEKSFCLELIQKAKTYPDKKGSSMLSDKLNGKQIELDAKIGIIFKKGMKNKISIPVTQKIYNLLLA